MGKKRKKIEKGEKMIPIFGTHRPPFCIERENLSISVSREGDGYVYRRISGEENKEKLVLSRDVTVSINPVEPLNCPMFLSPLLLLEMERPILIEPRSSRKVYLRFPVEIGVFANKGKAVETIDTFSVKKQKFTLYGDPKTGRICKYWKSSVYLKIPSCKPVSEGILELTITNTTGRWTEISKTVLDGYMMKILYNNSRVETKANMKITDHNSAETSFQKVSASKGMRGSLKILRRGSISPIVPHTVMEDGL